MIAKRLKYIIGCGFLCGLILVPSRAAEQQQPLELQSEPKVVIKPVQPPSTLSSQYKQHLQKKICHGRTNSQSDFPQTTEVKKPEKEKS